MTTKDPGRQDAPVPAAPEGSDTETTRSQIEETREDLGDTLEALSAKTDVKAQASAKANELKQRAHDVGGQAKQRADEVVDQVKRRPAPLIVGGIALVMILGLIRKRGRRRRERRTIERLASPDFPVRAVIVEPSSSRMG
jgi:hypothetical protein